MPKTKFFFLLLCGTLFSSNVFSQVDIKLYAGPQISSFWMSSISDNWLNDVPLMGFSADARLSFFSNNKFQLETGVGLNRKGNLVTGKVAKENGVDLSEYEIERYSNYNYYLEIPIQANLFLKEAKKGLFVLGSVRPNYIISEGTKMVFTNDTVRKEGPVNGDPNKFNILGRAGIGYEIPFSKLGISISSYFEHELINNSTVLKDRKFYYYSAGLLAGVRF